MTLLDFEGFDVRDVALPKGNWSAAQGATTTTTPFSTGSAWQVTSSSGGIQRIALDVTASAQIFCGFAGASGNTTNFGISFLDADGVTQHITICAQTDGSIQIKRGTATGTLLATSAAGVWPVDAVYRYLEATCIVDDVTGYVEVRVNGATVLTFSGDTRNGAGTTIGRLWFGWVGSGSNGVAGRIDDVYVCNALGSSPTNTFMGPWLRVQTLTPSGAGSSTQFTPISGSNFSNVNDIPDNTATYNSDTVSGHRDTFALADLDAGTGTVYGVKQTMHARQLDGGTATIKQAQKSGATVSYGPTRTITPTATGYSDVYTTNPATGSAWTVSDVNALEAGYEIA